MRIVVWYGKTKELPNVIDERTGQEIAAAWERVTQGGEHR